MEELQKDPRDLWFNRKTGINESLDNMTPSKLAFKLMITARRIADHQGKINRLRQIRDRILFWLEQKGRKLKPGEPIPEQFIYNSVVVTEGILKEHNIDVHKAIENGEITVVEIDEGEDRTEL